MILPPTTGRGQTRQLIKVIASQNWENFLHYSFFFLIGIKSDLKICRLFYEFGYISFYSSSNVMKFESQITFDEYFFYSVETIDK